MKKILLLLVLTLMLFSFAACSNKEAAAPAEQKAAEPAEEKTEPADGALTGTTKGYGGDVTVTVTVDGDDIVSVEAVGDSETNGVGSKAIEQLPALIAEADSTEVDGVSGATITSNAIKEAVNAALASK